MSTGFTGRTIIVTGAGSGIGRATASRLVAEGAHVVATDVSVPRLTELEAELSPGPGTLSTVGGDVRDAATGDALLAAAGPRIDGLANVAGIMDAFLPLAELDDETWDRVLDINLGATMKLTRAVLKVMLASGTEDGAPRGAIVNVSSEASVKSSASGTAYAVSKAGVSALTRSVAFFYGPQGVRCNAVAPGAVMTNIEAPMKSEFAASRVGPIMQTNIPAPAQSSDLASSIVWLLSDDSSNVNGAILMNDGGWSTV